jgi:MFS family permease
MPEINVRWRLAALSLVMLLPSLGTSVANVSLPSLAVSFGATFEDVQWVVISYLLAVTTLIVTAGKVGDLFGRRRPLLFGIALFMVSSIACALAPNIWALVAFRGIQGAGAALMMSLVVATVGDVVAPERTGSAIGLLGTVSAVGTALGPSLGGALISAFGWPIVFWLLAGVGVIALLSAPLLPPHLASPSRKPCDLDLAGTVLLAVTLGAYALATTAGMSTSGPTMLVLAALSLGALVAFIAVERRTDMPPWCNSISSGTVP